MPFRVIVVHKPDVQVPSGSVIKTPRLANNSHKPSRKHDLDLIPCKLSDLPSHQKQSRISPSCTLEDDVTWREHIRAFGRRFGIGEDLGVTKTPATIVKMKVSRDRSKSSPLYVERVGIPKFHARYNEKRPAFPSSNLKVRPHKMKIDSHKSMYRPKIEKIDEDKVLHLAERRRTCRSGRHSRARDERISSENNLIQSHRKKENKTQTQFYTGMFDENEEDRVKNSMSTTMDVNMCRREWNDARAVKSDEHVDSAAVRRAVRAQIESNAFTAGLYQSESNNWMKEETDKKMYSCVTANSKKSGYDEELPSSNFPLFESVRSKYQSQHPASAQSERESLDQRHNHRRMSPTRTAFSMQLPKEHSSRFLSSQTEVRYSSSKYHPRFCEEQDFGTTLDESSRDIPMSEMLKVMCDNRSETYMEEHLFYGDINSVGQKSVKFKQSGINISFYSDRDVPTSYPIIPRLSQITVARRNLRPVSDYNFVDPLIEAAPSHLPLPVEGKAKETERWVESTRNPPAGKHFQDTPVRTLNDKFQFEPTSRSIKVNAYAEARRNSEDVEANRCSRWGQFNKPDIKMREKQPTQKRQEKTYENSEKHKVIDNVSSTLFVSRKKDIPLEKPLVVQREIDDQNKSQKVTDAGVEESVYESRSDSESLIPNILKCLLASEYALEIERPIVKANRDRLEFTPMINVSAPCCSEEKQRTELNDTLNAMNSKVSVNSDACALLLSDHAEPNINKATKPEPKAPKFTITHMSPATPKKTHIKEKIKSVSNIPQPSLRKFINKRGDNNGSYLIKHEDSDPQYESHPTVENTSTAENIEPVVTKTEIEMPDLKPIASYILNPNFDDNKSSLTVFHRTSTCNAQWPRYVDEGSESPSSMLCLPEVYRPRCPPSDNSIIEQEESVIANVDYEKYPDHITEVASPTLRYSPSPPSVKAEVQTEEVSECGESLCNSVKPVASEALLQLERALALAYSNRRRSEAMKQKVKRHTDRGLTTFCDTVSKTKLRDSTGVDLGLPAAASTAVLRCQKRRMVDDDVKPQEKLHQEQVRPPGKLHQEQVKPQEKLHQEDVKSCDEVTEMLNKIKTNRRDLRQHETQNWIRDTVGDIFHRYKGGVWELTQPSQDRESTKSVKSSGIESKRSDISNVTSGFKKTCSMEAVDLKNVIREINIDKRLMPAHWYPHLTTIEIAAPIETPYQGRLLRDNVAAEVSTNNPPLAIPRVMSKATVVPPQTLKKKKKRGFFARLFSSNRNAEKQAVKKDAKSVHEKAVEKNLRCVKNMAEKEQKRHKTKWPSMGMIGRLSNLVAPEDVGSPGARRRPMTREKSSCRRSMTREKSSCRRSMTREESSCRRRPTSSMEVGVSECPRLECSRHQHGISKEVLVSDSVDEIYKNGRTTSSSMTMLFERELESQYRHSCGGSSYCQSAMSDNWLVEEGSNITESDDANISVYYQ